MMLKVLLGVRACHSPCPGLNELSLQRGRSTQGWRGLATKHALFTLRVTS